MSNSKLIKNAIISALLALLYIAGVVTFINSASKIFGKDKPPLTGMAFLLLFVISASVVGYLIIGRSLMLYLDGAKKEAVKLFAYKITSLAIIAILIFTGLIIF